jgi:phosphatidylglycerol:prolipoprotein diacylglycerol transferase
LGGAVVTIGIDPTLDIGPLSIAWHGLMTAVGIVVGSLLALRYARESGLRRDRLLDLLLVLVVAGFAGARLLFLIEDDAGALLRPGDWLATEGYSIYGALILGPAAAALYLRLRGGDLHYLDALAAGFPLGLAVGRIGDILIGEHHGPPSELPWAIAYSDPDALVPDTGVAYQPGALYESLLGLLLFALLWPLRKRFRTPGLLLATTVGLYAAGRFLIFFARSDSPHLALGLSSGQWISLGLIALTIAGAVWLRRRHGPPEPAPRARPVGTGAR